MKQIDVQIMGQSYVLGCPEDGEERLRIAVDKVDSAMCAIRDQGRIRARDRIAVLAALNLAFDLTDRGAAAANAGGAARPTAQAILAGAQAAAPQMPWAPSAAATPSAALSSEAEPQLELLLTKLDQALAAPVPAAEKN